MCVQEASFTADGFEQSVGVNHLSHFLLVNLLLEDLAKSPTGKPRCVIVGSGACRYTASTPSSYSDSVMLRRWPPPRRPGRVRPDPGCMLQ